MCDGAGRLGRKPRGDWDVGERLGLGRDSVTAHVLFECECMRIDACAHPRARSRARVEGRDLARRGRAVHASLALFACMHPPHFSWACLFEVVSLRRLVKMLLDLLLLQR
jgi:hypothetical protein